MAWLQSRSRVPLDERAQHLMQLTLRGGKPCGLKPGPRGVAQCCRVHLQFQQHRPGILRCAHVSWICIGVLAVVAARRVIGRTGLRTHGVGAAAAILQECAGEVGATVLVGRQRIDPARIREYPLFDGRRFRGGLLRAQVRVEGHRLVREDADPLVTAEGATGGAGDRCALGTCSRRPGIQFAEQLAGPVHAVQPR